jgi:hypothetical protein
MAFPTQVLVLLDSLMENKDHKGGLYIPVRRKDLGLCVGTVAYMCFLLTEMFLPKEQMHFNYHPVVPVGRCGDKGAYSTHGRHPPPCLALSMPDPGPFGTPSQPRVSTHLGGSIYPGEYRQGVVLGVLFPNGLE